MAKVILKKGANPKKVAKLLNKSGIIMGRRLEDGSYVAYKERKITLSDMLNRLQERMNYEEPEEAFDTLLYSWNKHRGASSASLASIKQRGTMSTTLARSFAEYCGYPIDRKA